MKAVYFNPPVATFRSSVCCTVHQTALLAPLPTSSMRITSVGRATPGRAQILIGGNFVSGPASYVVKPMCV